MASCFASIAATSSSVIDRQASSPAVASSPATTSMTSSASSSEIEATRAPRFGRRSSSPSVARILIASRSGVREMPKRSASSSSFTRARGSSTPSRISSRRRSATSSCR